MSAPGMAARDDPRPAGLPEVETTLTRILFFGRVAEHLGPDGQLDLPAEGCSIAGIRSRLAAQGQIAADALLRPDVLASVDQVVVDDDTLVRPGQEIAFFSLFSGG